VKIINYLTIDDRAVVIVRAIERVWLKPDEDIIVVIDWNQGVDDTSEGRVLAGVGGCLRKANELLDLI